MAKNHISIQLLAIFFALICLVQCSSSDAPNIPAVGDQFCMDVDADSYPGQYTRDANDTDAAMQALTLVTCVAPYDCDDGDSSVFPNAVEILDDTIDQDCDLVADVSDDASGDDDVATCDDGSAFITYYLDEDGDGYGTTITTQACELPTGYSSVNTDCDDTDAEIYPGTTDCPET